MVVPEQVGEVVRGLRLRLDDAGPGLLEQPPVVPEVLDALAQVVETLDRWRLLDRRERRAAAFVGARRAVDERVVVAALERPVLDPRGDAVERRDGVRGGGVAVRARLGAAAARPARSAANCASGSCPA